MTTLSRDEPPDDEPNELQTRWLTKRLWYHGPTYLLLYSAIWATMKTVFRLRAIGLENIPESGAYLLTPNHSSSLDPAAIGAAMGYRRVGRLWWAGWDKPILKTGIRRFVNRTAQVMPIERGKESLVAAAAILRRESPLAWFPEGTRSTDGELQPFKSGAGLLLNWFPIPAIPCHIEGTYRAMPAPGHSLRALPAITVRFGKPVFAADHADLNEGELTDLLHDRVAALRDEGQKSA